MNPAFLAGLKTGDVFRLGALFPALCNNELWWQVTTTNPELPAVECRIYFMDIPMGTARLVGLDDGTVEVRR